jgi:hypothetical protein
MIGPTDRYKAVGSLGWASRSATLAAPAAKGNADPTIARRGPPD